jgi:hypothetical protein
MNTGKDRLYHKEKVDLAREKGIRLYTFWDDTDIDLIKSMIASKLGLNEKVRKKIDIERYKWQSRRFILRIASSAR